MPGSALARAASPVPDHQLFQRVGAACDRHQQRLAGTGDVRAHSRCPLDVRCDQPQAAAVALRGQGRGAEREVERRAESVRGNAARQPHGPPDVLVVNRAVGQRDPTAHRRRKPARPLAACHEINDPGRVQPPVPVERDLVDLARTEPTADEDGRGLHLRQLVVADDVGGNLAYGPLGAQRRGVPLVGSQLAQQCQELGTLLPRKWHQVRPGHGASSSPRVSAS